MSRAVAAKLVFGQTQLYYTVRRSPQRRTIAITVNPDASVLVLAPRGARRERVAKLVQAKAAWMLRRQDWLRRHYRRRPREFVSGEALLYLGRQYHLRVVRQPGVRYPGVRLTKGLFLVTVPPNIPSRRRQSMIRATLVRWYRAHAGERLQALAGRLAARLGVTYRSVSLRDMPTRWGSGGPDGHLRFNWRIVMAPPRLVEYVVAHELCHLRHARHTPAFRRLLASAMPDHEYRCAQLARQGPTLDL